MRHKKSFNHLSRRSAHRKAMLANMASSLIIHKRIHTTTAKAKALKRYIEPLITRSREDSTHSRRMVFSYLQDKEAVTELFREVVLKVGERPGGYTRIIRIGSRQGDNADMCMMELVDYNPTLLAEKEASRKPSRRRRGGRSRSGGKKAEPAAAEKRGPETEEQVPETEGQAPEAEELAGATEQAATEAEEEKPEGGEEPQSGEPEANEEPKAEAGSVEPGAAEEEESGEKKDENQAGEEEKKD